MRQRPVAPHDQSTGATLLAAKQFPRHQANRQEDQVESLAGGNRHTENERTGLWKIVFQSVPRQVRFHVALLPGEFPHCSSARTSFRSSSFCRVSPVDRANPGEPKHLRLQHRPELDLLRRGSRTLRAQASRTTGAEASPPRWRTESQCRPTAGRSSTP